VWDYYSSNYSTLLDHKDKLFANIYIFMKKTRSKVNIQDAWTCWN
jgi:hypothetical protein